MGVRSRSRGARYIAALGAAGLILASGLVASATGRRTGLRTSGAYWTSSAPTGSLSSTVYVSAVNCRGIRGAQFVGQRSGEELFGSFARRGAIVHPFDFAGFYGYCRGHSAHYAAEFVVSEPNAGLLVFRPAGFHIAPADPLQISIVTRGARVTLSIYDVNTHRRATTVGPSLGLRTGWVAGVLPLFGSTGGRPILRGSLRLLNEYSPTGGPNTLPGPAPFSPVVFRSYRINGHALSYGRTIGSSSWRGFKGSDAHVTHPKHGSFIAIGKLKPPKLGSSADVLPVSGTTLIRTPGHHKFQELNAGTQIPDGSTIDTTHGSAQITLGLSGGRSETGVFYDGQFRLHQNGRSGDTTATLEGGSTAICTLSSGNAIGIASAARAKKPKKHKHSSRGKKIRGLWANAHGNFTTKGSGGAAAVLGTKWYTEDTCSGTYFHVVRDKIRVTVYYPHIHTVLVTQGHSFFAPNDVPTITLAPLSSSNGRYNAKLGSYYGMTVVSPFQPYYVTAAVAPQPPAGGNYALSPDGTVNGVARWHFVFQIEPNLSHFQDWNIGVRVHGTLYVVKLRVK